MSVKIIPVLRYAEEERISACGRREGADEIVSSVGQAVEVGGGLIRNDGFINNGLWPGAFPER